MSINSAIRQVVRDVLRDVWTLTVAKVDRVYPTEMRCDVTLLNIRGQIPISINGVRVLVQRFGNTAILLPLQKGDLVVLAFSKTGLEDVLSSSERMPFKGEQFKIQDAIVIGTLMNNSEVGKILWNNLKYEIPLTDSIIVNDNNILLAAPGVQLLTSDTLPTPSAEYRGQLRMTKSGTGERDHLYMCVKRDDESYTWYDFLFDCAEESQGLSSTTSDEFQTKVTLALCDIQAGYYLLFGNAQIGGEDPNFGLEGDMYDGSSQLDITQIVPSGRASDGHFMSHTMMAKLNLSAGSHTFYLRWRSTVAGKEAVIQHAELYMRRFG